MQDVRLVEQFQQTVWRKLDMARVRSQEDLAGSTFLGDDARFLDVSSDIDASGKYDPLVDDRPNSSVNVYPVQ